jgi:hypothetical protein
MALPTVKLARKTVELYPDMQVSDEVEAALDALEEAKKAVQAETDSPQRTLASKALSAANKALKEAEKAGEDIEARAKSSVLEVVMDQMPKKAWREFETAHPPREGDKVDELYTINWDTFVGAYLEKMSPQVRWQESGEPVEVIPSEWPAWVETISDPEYQKLATAILALNRQKAARPF